MPEREAPFACDMTAIPADRRDQHRATLETLIQSVESLRELPNGYAFRLSDEANVLDSRSFHLARAALLSLH